MHRFSAVRIVATLAFVTVASVALSNTASARTTEQIYQEIKGLEETSFPLPTPYGETVVGTFNAATGKFDGYVTITEIIGGADDEPGSGPVMKPKKIKEIPQVTVNGVQVGLIFKVKNRQGSFRATANLRSATAPVGQDSVTIKLGNIKNGARVNWSVSSGNKSYKDTLFIDRPRIVGAGAFTIPALPVAIVYEPPQDSQKTNTASYSVTKSIGTTIRIAFGQEKSTTTPAKSQFEDTMTMKSNLDKLGTGLAATGNPYAAAAGAALKVIAKGLGEASATKTEGTKVTSEHSLQVTDTQTATSTTGVHKGPGIGDRIIYYKKPKLVWMMDGNRLTLALLDRGTPARDSVEVLQEALKGNVNVGLDNETIQALLALDPFVAGGPQATLAAPRYDTDNVETFEGSGGTDSFTFTHEVATSDMNSTANFTSRTDEMRKGFLSFVGLGVTEDKKVTSTSSHSSSREVAVKDIVTASVNFTAQGLERYAIEGYYDRAFGTFAFKEVPQGAKESISGIALDANGKPAAKQMVTLQMGKRKFMTRTDEQGRYSFRSATIPQGEGTLILGAARKPLNFRGAPLQNQELRAAPKIFIRPPSIIRPRSRR